ncbi:AraC family transcriptional regulator [Marinomonas transparens]|uniref:AraC family transcriptional regulator n=1 Tax=Marinomonas transparens TaxID=2795388 RepID=A0A934MWX2_9GAMM|nr:AraC family transcriptional regulator [Marinomonas transparens]MBJ7538659.1 AraC family transcriptional regulator [Marinomonas transparens]
MTTIQRDITQLADPLGETLYQLRLNGSLYCRSILTAPWGIEMPVIEDKMMFHIITSGNCWLQVNGEEPYFLRQGALALVPHGRGHRITDELDVPCEGLFDIPVDKVSERYEIMHYGGGGKRTEMTCGVVSFDHLAGHHLVAQLPKVLVIDSLGADTDGWLQHTLRFIAQEARVLKPGGETLITHLADILLIQVIRHWIESSPEAGEGWLAALKDKQIGKALAAIHRHPEQDWTVEALAREVGMSRSGFSARFSELVGDSAKHYLTRLRMQIARNKLMNSVVPIAIVAEQMGYGSEAAFSRAFKRCFGFSPSHARH